MMPWRTVDATTAPEPSRENAMNTVSPARRSEARIGFPSSPLNRVFSLIRIVRVTSVGRLSTIVPLAGSTEETMKNSSVVLPMAAPRTLFVPAER